MWIGALFYMPVTISVDGPVIWPFGAPSWSKSVDWDLPLSGDVDQDFDILTEASGINPVTALWWKVWGPWIKAYYRKLKPATAQKPVLPKAVVELLHDLLTRTHTQHATAKALSAPELATAISTMLGDLQQRDPDAYAALIDKLQPDPSKP